MRIALEVDNIAALGEELALLPWVCDWRQSVPIGLHEVHSLLHLIEGSQLVEHEFLGFHLLGSDTRHVLVGRGGPSERSLSEILLHMRIEAIKEGLEGGVLSSLRDARNSRASWLVVVFDEVLGDLHACVLLFGTRRLTLPDVDSVIELKNVRVRVIEMSAGQWPLSHLRCDHLA